MMRLSRANAGFTLIELLVAATVGVLLLMLLVGIVSQSMTATRRANNSLMAANSAAAAVDLLASDMDSMVGTRQPFEFFQTSSENLAGLGVVSQVSLISLPGGENAEPPDHGQARAIRYEVLHQDPINDGGNKKTFGLYRTVISSSATFTDYLGKTDLAEAFNATPPSLDDFLVGDVLDFQLRFYTANATLAANKSGGIVQPVRLSGNGTLVNGTSYSGAPLVWAEVTIVVLKDIESAIARLEDGTLNREDAITRYGQRITRRIPIRSTF